MYLFIYSETLRLGSLPSKLSAPHSRVSIIPPDQIVAIDAMATEQFTIAQITEQFDMGAEAVAEQKNSALKWLAKYGLIANTMTCSNDECEDNSPAALIKKDSKIGGYVVSIMLLLLIIICNF